MSDIPSLSPFTQSGLELQPSGSDLTRALPEPRGSGGVPNLWPVATQALSAVGSLVGAGTGLSGSPSIANLLNQQIEIQMVMQVVSMRSNIERSRHEIEMAPIRNMRVG